MAAALGSVGRLGLDGQHCLAISPSHMRIKRAPESICQSQTGMFAPAIRLLTSLLSPI